MTSYDLGAAVAAGKTMRDHVVRVGDCDWLRGGRQRLSPVCLFVCLSVSLSGLMSVICMKINECFNKIENRTVMFIKKSKLKQIEINNH